jgi:predicted GNAT family N-acyltransferase
LAAKLLISNQNTRKACLAALLVAGEDKIMKNYVFKLTQKKAYPDVDTSGFFMLDTFTRTLKHLPVLAAHFSVIELLKLLRRSLLGNRYFYYIKKDGKVVSRGQLSTGFCNYYQVESNAVVIGSIWTDPQCRGQGLASKSMQAAINYMVTKGQDVFYIDTQQANTGMLKSIAKNGFGQPVTSFEN